jgi:nitrate reductase gamma subunit
MPVTEPSPLLHSVEIVHWIALGVMAVVYTLRIRWLLSFRATRDRQAPSAPARTGAQRGAMYSLANVMMPWAMESTRRGFPFYLTFVLFHLGVVAGISLAFLSTISRPFLQIPAVAAATLSLLVAAFLIGLYRIARRLLRRVMRLISTPDDYFSVTLLTCWFLLGAFAELNVLGEVGGEGVMVAYLLLTSFFLLYVPFSKISHYLYYPFTRIWLGRTLGHRGVFPLLRG